MKCLSLVLSKSLTGSNDMMPVVNTILSLLLYKRVILTKMFAFSNQNASVWRAGTVLNVPKAVEDAELKQGTHCGF